MAPKTASSIAFVCTAWSLLYLIYGNTPRGKSWFGHVTSKVLSDSKAVPIITLAAPLLISTSACILLHRRSSTNSHNKSQPLQPIMRHWKLSFRHGSNTRVNIVSFLIVFVPCLCFFVSGIYRQLRDQRLSFDYMTEICGKSFGILSAVSLSFFLVPVARHSPLLKLMDWSEVEAVTIHIWAGRLGIFGAVGHGLIYMGRSIMQEESVMSMILPPLGCWRIFATQTFDPTHMDSMAELSCYCHFRNLTGFLAAAALCIIGITSISFVRRKCYRLFYSLHVLLGPFSVLMAVFHWKRMMLYLCPSIIYYLASSVPVFMQQWMCYRKNGVRILSVAELSSGVNGDGAGSCVSVDINASERCMETLRPGQYVKLCVPEISLISHPFTVNACEGGGIRIIFRAAGPFTRALAKRLCHPSAATAPTGTMPKVLVDGFYGTQHRCRQVLSHDVVLIVAAGIGITPYLSLITDLVTMTSPESPYRPQTQVFLHWVCRDESLVEYVSRKYFDPLVQDQWLGQLDGMPCCVSIKIHKTTGSSRSQISISPTRTCTGNYSTIFYGEKETEHKSLGLDSQGVPMIDSRFCAGTNDSVMKNINHFLTFSFIACLSLLSTYLQYRSLTSKTAIAPRTYGLLATLVISLSISFASNALVDDDQSNDTILSSLGQLYDCAKLWLNKIILRKCHPSELEFERGYKEIQSELSLPNPNSSDATGGRHACEHDECFGSHRDNTSEITAPTSLSRSQGRPSLHTLLSCLEDARNPGIFMCGPMVMMSEIREAAVARGNANFCRNGSSPAFYPETFEV